MQEPILFNTIIHKLLL